MSRSRRFVAMLGVSIVIAEPSLTPPKALLLSRMSLRIYPYINAGLH
jgi:hypothetical protein